MGQLPGGPGSREGRTPGRAGLNEVLRPKAIDFRPLPGAGMAVSREKSITLQEGQGGQVPADRQQGQNPSPPREDRADCTGTGPAPRPSGGSPCGHHPGGPGRQPLAFLPAALPKATDREPGTALANTTGLPVPYLQLGKSSANGNFLGNLIGSKT